MNPLDQLRDMHTPPPPGWWPPAPGWWILAALLLAALLAIGAFAVKRYRRRRYRREALTLLARQREESANPALDALQLVRRVARSAAPASDWATLSSAELLRRLDEFDGRRLSRELARHDRDLATLARALYQPDPALDPDVERRLLDTVHRWIRRHRRAQLC